MVAWIPLIATGLGGLGLGAGASGGGMDILSGIEIGTKKEQTTSSYQTTENIQETYNISPVTTRTYDIQYNIASGGGSTITTKKEQAIEQTPETMVVPETYITPQIIPLMTQGAGAESSAPIGSSGTATGGGINFAQILLIAGIGLGIYYLFFSDKEESK